jgi:hypothetical protein
MSLAHDGTIRGILDRVCFGIVTRVTGEQSGTRDEFS